MVEFCVVNLYYPVEIGSSGYGPPGAEPYHPYDDARRLSEYMDVKDGLLLGSVPSLFDGRSKEHAVAWNMQEQLIYDPDGVKYPKERFEIYSMFVLF